ncbi:MAG: hypothetical protein KKA79_05630 [Nanoarchaeota archaeon]|nr:hypothetical protein [Nanoarchaeota archaeon]
MKLPKSFRPEKDLDSKIKELVNLLDSNQNTIKNILESSEEFISKYDDYHDIRKLYGLGQDLSMKIDYTDSDLTVLSEKLRIDNTIPFQGYIGIYLNALVDKIAGSYDSILLAPQEPIDGLGTLMEKGTIIIKGNVGNYTGSYMQGGYMIVKGHTGMQTGYSMRGGIIDVRGSVQGDYGIASGGGRIIVRVRKQK